MYPLTVSMPSRVADCTVSTSPSGAWAHRTRLPTRVCAPPVGVQPPEVVERVPARRRARVHLVGDVAHRLEPAGPIEAEDREGEQDEIPVGFPERHRHPVTPAAAAAR